MGLYDTIICKYPLPGIEPEFFAHQFEFQTKDLDCTMSHYTIDSEGNFSQPNFTGKIEFYASNISGSGPAIYTHSGEDYENVSYEATFIDSKLKTLVQTQYDRQPAWPISKMFSGSRVTQEDINARKARNAESLLGHDIYVLWGGQEDGYHAKVVYESDREICVQITSEEKGGYHFIGSLELIDRSQRDNTFFDTEEIAKSTRKAEKDAWNSEKGEFEKYQKTRKKVIDKKKHK